LAGKLGDKNGFKLVAVCVPLLDAGAAALALCAPSVSWFYALFFLGGCRVAFHMVGMHNLCIDYCPTDDKTAFVALTSTVMCPAYVIGPFLGGCIATWHAAGHDAVFVVALVTALLSFVTMAAFVDEPRNRTGRRELDAGPAVAHGTGKAT